jgi:hypothetical protein
MTPATTTTDPEVAAPQPAPPPRRAPHRSPNVRCTVACAVAVAAHPAAEPLEFAPSSSSLARSARPWRRRCRRWPADAAEQAARP